MQARLKIFLGIALTLSAVSCFGQAPAKQPEDKTTIVFGQTIHYWDVGSGPVLVLVHGLGSSKDGDWGRVVAPLSKKYRVIAMDQVGFGRSDKPLIDYKIQTYVDFLNEFLHVLKVEKASFMRKLLEAVFYDTSWVTDEVLQKSFADKLARHDGYTVRAILSNPSLASERLDDRLAQIHVPTLVVWGKQDTLLPITSGERYAAGIAGAKLVSFDQCGHVPPVEKTSVFVPVVEAFLDGTAATPH